MKRQIFYFKAHNLEIENPRINLILLLNGKFRDLQFLIRESDSKICVVLELSGIQKFLP